MPAPLRHRAWLFDLDGTLVDTAPDLADAVNHALARANVAPWPESNVRNWVGHGSRVLIEKALAASGRSEPADPYLDEFFTYYAAHIADRSALYPHVRKVLRELRARGARLAVVTNKIARFTHPLLAALDLAPLFDAVVCGDSTPQSKPHPAPIHFALEALGTPLADAAMVGDSESDVGAARAAGIPVYAVTFGYNHGRAVAELAPDALLDSMADLPMDP